MNRGRMTTQGCSIMKRWAVRFIIGFRCAVSNFNGCFRHATRSRQEGKQQTGKQSKRGKPNCLTILIRLADHVYTQRSGCAETVLGAVWYGEMGKASGMQGSGWGNLKASAIWKT